MFPTECFKDHDIPLGGKKKEKQKPTEKEKKKKKVDVVLQPSQVPLRAAGPPWST